MYNLKGAKLADSVILVFCWNSSQVSVYRTGSCKCDKMLKKQVWTNVSMNEDAIQFQKFKYSILLQGAMVNNSW